MTEEAVTQPDTAELISSLHAQTRLLKQWIRPYVIADVYPRRFVNMLYFRIRNVGQIPAFNIHVELDRPVPIRDKTSDDYAIFHEPISVLGPQEEFSFFFNSAIKLLDSEEPLQEFTVTLTYNDSEGAEYRTSLPINIQAIKDLALALPTETNILDELQRIRKQIEKIARYADRLRQEKMVADYEASKAREQEDSET